MTTPGFNWKPDISLGNIVTWAMMLVALGMAWSDLNSRVEYVSEKVESIVGRVAAAEIEAKSVAATYTADRIRLTEKLSDIQADIRILRQAFERMNGERLGAVPKVPQ